VHFYAQRANDSKSLFIIPKFDLHADIFSKSEMSKQSGGRVAEQQSQRGRGKATAAR
jgi:hypothetical protein